MDSYVTILMVLGVMTVLQGVSQRLKVSSTMLLIIVGLAFGFVPSMSSLQVQPEIIFLLFLPPLLFEATFNISFKDFRDNLDTIGALAFGLVFITTAGIAVIAHYMIPGMTWPVAFVLGSTLAATDAVAAISITRNLGMTKLASTILESESLINDASALVAYQFAVAAVAGTEFIWWNAILKFLVLIGGAIGVGAVIFVLLRFFLRLVWSQHLALLSLILILPFVTYLVAEEVHVSGVIAVVALGFGFTRLSDKVFPADLKQASKTIWNIVVFLLNGLIFILIGIEFPLVLKSIDQHLWLPYIGYAFIITVVALIIRSVRVVLQRRKLLMVFHNPRYQNGKRRVSQSMLLTFQDGVIISWSGMRGIVSLAMAISLPVTLANGEPFPMRNEIIFITTAVVLFTILGQGLLLPIIVKRIRKENNASAESEAHVNQ
ncbi:Na+/H+ antiporter [Chryseolinea sp. T2]|uniref:Na+/H+ antiporter n=1 Tax=Chryseolinea sp. T2 TaxID=3129255 RepID=UPI003076EB93